MNPKETLNYHNIALTPYYKENKYPSPAQVKKISLDWIFPLGNIYH